MASPIFLAAPSRGDGALAAVDKLLVTLEPLSGGKIHPSEVWNAHLRVGDVGVDATPEAWFEKSLTALQEAQVVVAVLDGPQVDEDVAFWLGYAFAAEKAVIGYRSDRRASGAMVRGAAGEVVADARALAKALVRALGR